MAPSRTHLPTRGDVGQAAVIAALGARGPQSRADLARALKVGPATITHITKSLIASGMVTELDAVPSGGGRPARLLGLLQDQAGAIGVKVTPDHVTTVEVGLDGSAGTVRRVSFDPSAPTALDVLTDHVERAVREHEGLLLGVGIGIPGSVDEQETGSVTAPTLGWTDVPVGTFISRAVGVPVIVDNDVNTLAVAERLYGVASGYDSPMIITIGRGIGCGLIVDGSLHRGVAGGAGEIGHIPLSADGPTCNCGASGCLEAYIGEAALVERARSCGVIDARAGAEGLCLAADKGDERALHIYRAAGELLGRVVAGVCHTVAPDAVVILGEGTDAWSHWQEGFEQSFRRHLLPSRRSLPYVVETWAEERWAIGAACLVLYSPLDATNTAGEQGRQVRARLNGTLGVESRT